MPTSQWLTYAHVFSSLLLLPNLFTLTSAVLAGKTMRIQPLGDSITFGYLSTDGNGYRNALLERLIAPITVGNDTSANTVLYVGSVQSGTMENNNNEGHNGAIISQIATYANLSLPERPNVVLLHAGTNDMTFDVMTDAAPDRVSSLIDQIHSQCPDALIVLAKIIMATNTTTQARSNIFNAALPALVDAKVAAGLKVQLVDMTGIPITELQDGIHPTDQGYNDMSEVWYQGLVAADERGWIGKPVRTNITNAALSGAATTTIRLGGTSVLPSATASVSARATMMTKSGVSGLLGTMPSLELMIMMVAGLIGIGRLV